MKRRTFLAMLGLAPAAGIVAKAAEAAPVIGNVDFDLPKVIASHRANIGSVTASLTRSPGGMRLETKPDGTSRIVFEADQFEVPASI
ncbi:hypothetical protein [Aquamicrobium sp. LC103]|uniref:hypothetical protein n=1 Tax=Aquamicrobium sp. LC103 TaxID=1120658 RepID=UPI00063EAA2C|nr:hypothetical protein [Aquamicrobium sp. LC103]TKT78429.1 hypothetical protein XW59_012500 [Aquamicrobium sp. LC103]